MVFNDRWTVRVPERANDVAELMRRAADYLEEIGSAAVDRVVVDREGSELVLTACFNHRKLPSDLEYLDPRYAADFDAAVDARDDFDFMLALAEETGARCVIDLGCGTGRLAMSLASDGRRVVGVDPAPPMIAEARSRDGDGTVEWIVGDASAITITNADLVVMTGNVSGYVTDDDEWLSVLHRVRAALRPDGVFAFGSRNPAYREWERWGPGVSFDSGRIRVAAALGDDQVHADPEQASIAYGDEILIADSEYRVRTVSELRSSLKAAGLDISDVFGGWDRRTTLDGPDVVFVARRV